MIGFPQIGQTAPFSAWGAGVPAGAPWRPLGACLPCPWVFPWVVVPWPPWAVCGGPWTLLFMVEPDVSVPVRDHQFANLPAVVIGDVGDGEAGVRIAFQDFLPSVLAFGIELVVGQFDIDEGACVEFAADPHVEAGRA